MGRWLQMIPQSPVTHNDFSAWWSLTWSAELTQWLAGQGSLQTITYIYTSKTAKLCPIGIVEKYPVSGLLVKMGNAFTISSASRSMTPNTAHSLSWVRTTIAVRKKRDFSNSRVWWMLHNFHIITLPHFQLFYLYSAATIANPTQLASQSIFHDTLWNTYCTVFVHGLPLIDMAIFHGYATLQKGIPWS